MTNNREDDGRVMLGWLTERKSVEGKTYFKGVNFGAVDLLLIGSFPPLYNEKGERVWKLCAVPRTRATMPGSRGGAARAKPSLGD